MQVVSRGDVAFGMGNRRHKPFSMLQMILQASIDRHNSTKEDLGRVAIHHYRPDSHKRQEVDVPGGNATVMLGPPSSFVNSVVGSLQGPSKPAIIARTATATTSKCRPFKMKGHASIAPPPRPEVDQPPVPPPPPRPGLTTSSAEIDHLYSPRLLA